MNDTGLWSPPPQLPTPSKADEQRRLMIENMLFREMIEEQQLREAEISTFKSILSGGWRLLTSTNTAPYLSHRSASDLEDVIFQLADIFFEFTHNHLLTYYKVGGKKYEEKKTVLKEPTYSENVGRVTFFCSKTTLKLKTIVSWDLNNGDLEKSETFVDSEDKLHIRISRFGVECERIYVREKMEASRSFNGDWKNVTSSEVMSLKVHGNFYFERFDFTLDFEQFQIHRPTVTDQTQNQKLIYVYREHDKLVKVEFLNGRERNRWERFLMDGLLYEHFFWDGRFNTQEVYRRI